MIRDLFINTAIIISFISIEYQVFISIEHQMFFSKGGRERKSLLHRFFRGIMGGILGIMLMLFSVEVTPSVILDFRNIPLIVSTLYSGILSGFLTGGIIAAFRLLYFGISASSISALIVIALALFGFSFVTKSALSIRRKWFLCVLLYLMTGTVAFFTLVDDIHRLRDLLLAFWIGTSCVAVLVASYVEYLQALVQTFLLVKEESRKDHLTGLNNVRQFDRVYNEAVKRVQDSGEGISLLYIDIDFFKRVNDTFGHLEGDRVLCEFSQVLSRICRNIDTVSRNGGEEFSVLLPGCSGDAALDVAERIRMAVENHSFLLSDGKGIRLTVSIGVSSQRSGAICRNELLERADAALYEAKRTGRNRVFLSEERVPAGS